MTSLDVSGFFSAALQWLTHLSLRWKVVLSLVAIVSLMEFGVQRVPHASRLYRSWRAMILHVGEFWTAIILSFVYVVGVGPVNLFFRLTGRSLLDRALDGSSSAWRSHVPNPLGPAVAARHQF